MDIDKGMISVSFQDNPYTPKSVYRALLKIALSLLDESVVTTAYQPAIDLLMGGLDMNGCVLRVFQFPYSTAFSPYALFFQKKDRLVNYHTHVMMLYVQNFIFHLPMPLHVNDLPLYDGSKAMSILPAVPFVNEKTSPDITISVDHTDAHLLEQTALGSADAFTQLFYPSIDSLHRLTWSVTGSRAIADDVCRKSF